MPRLVDIVLLDKTIVAQPLLGCDMSAFPPLRREIVCSSSDCRVATCSARASGYVTTILRPVSVCQRPSASFRNMRLGASSLPIFDVAFKSRREHCHSPLAEKARQVLIEIAGIVERIAHGKHRAFAFGNRRQQHRRRRTGQSICRALPVTQQSGDSLSPLRSKKYIYQILFRIHLS